MTSSKPSTTAFARDFNDSAQNRRDFLRLAAFSSLTGLASGCVPTSVGSVPDAVWGRYGFSEGRFVKPRAVTIDDRDQLYIVDTTGRIQVFDADGVFQRFWSTPEAKNGRPTGLGYQPASSAKDGVAKILVADTHYYRMLVYTTDGELISSAQIGGTAGHLPGQFAFLTDAASDSQGNFYVGEYNASDRIQKFDPDGTFLHQWGGTGHSPGQFFRPQSLMIEKDVLWIADSGNHRIQRFDLSGKTPELIDVWGGPGEQLGKFYYPYGLAMASDGSILVVEYKNNRVQRLAPDSRPIATWGSPGLEPGMLNNPWGVVVDSVDRVHVLDSNNHRIQRFFLPV